MARIKKHIPVVLFLLLTITANGEIKLPKVIGSNMVLQREKPVIIWGEASPGEKLTVSFLRQVKKTIADERGKWSVILDPMHASRHPAQMVISGNDSKTLENILVGEVWLCSGQSNMEYTMTKSSKYANAKYSKGLTADALKTEANKNIRLFLVKRDLNKPGDLNKGWQEAEGEAVGTFSAAGYFFAKKLQQELGIPVGIIASSISGSAIEPWLPGAVEKNAQGLHINEQVPGKFFDGMIRPLAPFTLKGFLWYQGETNCFLKETDEYSFKFKHLISAWRKLWNSAAAPFYFVQIAPFFYSKSKGKIPLDDESLPEFREAQAASLELPQTGMVITTDLVDNLEDIHPSYKWEIGRRLALLALANTYDHAVASSGPVFKSARVQSNAIEVEFDHTAGGLQSKDGQPLNGFTIAGADGRYSPADAIIRGNKVIVSSASILNPMHVRFAWHEAAQPNLYNKAGLPAAPFRTDRSHHSTAKQKPGW